MGAYHPTAMAVHTVVERGPKGKKVVAFAVDWPGWSRGAKTPDLALETLESYRERYRPVAAAAGMAEEFDGAGPLDVVEDRVGTGSTDFWGISFAPASLEREPMDDIELDRKIGLLRACWAYFDAVAARVSPAMRKGPRGGGRDRDQIIRHTIRTESEEFAKRLGLRYRRAVRSRRKAYATTARRMSPPCGRTTPAKANACDRGTCRSSSATAPTTRWTTRGRWRTRTSPPPPSDGRDVQRLAAGPRVWR
jgi:hypothetical protein